MNQRNFVAEDDLGRNIAMAANDRKYELDSLTTASLKQAPDLSSDLFQSEGSGRGKSRKRNRKEATVTKEIIIRLIERIREI